MEGVRGYQKRHPIDNYVHRWRSTMARTMSNQSSWVPFLHISYCIFAFLPICCNELAVIFAIIVLFFLLFHIQETVLLPLGTVLN